jgi:O-antigen ligase
VLYYYKPKLGITLGGIAVLGVLGLVGVYLFGSGQSNSRFLVNKNNSSDVIRRSQWKAAIIATKEKPVLGWGLSNFHSQLKRIKTDYDLDAKDYNDAHSHNLFLEIASGTGLVGLVLFLGWVLSWAWESFKAGGLTRALVIPFGVAFVVSSQFEVTFDANNASMIFFLYGLSKR